MGNGGAKLTRCLSLFRRPAAALPSNPSFSYAFPLSSSFKSRLPSFRSISGAALSANLHTPSAFGSSFEPLDLLHSAQGLAGEDRLHVVLSPDHTSLFVGIYDGFNGPDAADFLLSNLYPAVHLHLTALQRPGRRHTAALRALSRALRDTERAFLEAADSAVSENPELALMGSCVLVLLLKNDDLYLMNVGDSRAVLAQEMAEDEPPLALQLTRDHCTCVEEEVSRIRSEHPEDALAVMNNRVKGSLKVTRAFGAGFLKQPNWNNALLEMFRVNYVGTSPYINCSPFLCHHRLCSRDRFLILSSDGLFQYFSNEEAVAEVESFAETTPGGDPAQHLAHQLLIRAAKNAGMDFRELIEIPRGDRRRYHDDVSIIIISFHGRRIWNSCI